VVHGGSSAHVPGTLDQAISDILPFQQSFLKLAGESSAVHEDTETPHFDTEDLTLGHNPTTICCGHRGKHVQPFNIQ